MAENQTEIGALMAEVSALAGETVGEIAGAPESERDSPESGGADSPAAGVEPGPAPFPRTGNIQRVLDIEVPVIVRLAERSMPLAEILNLTSGAIIEFDKPADGELDLLINNKCIGHGLAVKLNENFGRRLTRIGSVQDRIKAMGS